MEAPLEACGLHALMSYMRFARKGKQDQVQVLYNWIFRRTTGTLAHFFSSSQINYALCSFRIGFFYIGTLASCLFSLHFFSPLTGFKHLVWSCTNAYLLCKQTQQHNGRHPKIKNPIAPSTNSRNVSCRSVESEVCISYESFQDNILKERDNRD